MENLNPLVDQKQATTELNDQQKRAILHKKGPLLIIAGAGSGKTKTLTSRIAQLIKDGTRPGSILAITFTNKAAEEMKNRVEKLLSASGQSLVASSYPFLGTFHSWGARVLKSEALHLGRTANFSIFDNDDSRKILKEIIKLKNLDKEKYPPQAFEAKIGKIKNEGLDPEELKASNNPLDILAYDIFNLYEVGLRKNNAFDFDDLIEKVVYLFKKKPEILQKYQSRYSHILVDEYQDVNTLQYTLVRLLSAPHGNIFVIGDDAQSIYAFRGSDFRNFLNFDKDWPDATVIKLEENYRSSGNIVVGASELIKNNSLQKPKSLWTQKENGELIQIHGFSDEDDEAYFVIGKIVDLFRNPNSHPEVAILYRTNAQSRAIEQALIQNGIPYRVYGGLKFYDRMEIKDLLACLHYAANPSNAVAADRIHKNFNKKEAEVLLLQLPRMASSVITSLPASGGAAEAISDSPAPSLKSDVPNIDRGISDIGLPNIDSDPSSLRVPNSDEWRGNLTLSSKNSSSLIDLINFIINTTNYIEYLEKSYKNGRERVENVNEFIAFAGTFDHLGLAQFLEQVSLVSSMETPNGKLDTKRIIGTPVALMTVHASKGLEFNQVFVAGCNEGLLPHERSISSDFELEEERRLMYVAMTRAKRELHLSFFGTPSRFLYEIPIELTFYKDHSSARKNKLSSYEDEDFIEYD